MTALQPLGVAQTSDQTKYFVYVGTYGKGIHGYRFDTATANLESIGLVGQVVNPSFLATDREFRFLYAVSELEGKVNGGVAAFAIDRKTGSLKLLNTASSAGEAPCHLAVDHTTKMLVVANYGTGSVPVFPIERDGRLGEMSALMTAQGSSVNRQRQEGPHAHEAVISADNHFLYVPDLGLDQIRIYRLDPSNAKLVPNNPAFIKADPGSGPRHMAFSPNGKFAYVVHELKSVITVFSHDASSGNLNPIQTVSTLPEGFSKENAPAEIEVDRGGKFLYASNRGPGTIAVFSIDHGNGTLRQIQVVETGGTFPRGFQIDPSGQFLFSGDQKSNQFVLFRVDQKSGHLTLTDRRFDVPSPVAFQFVPAK
ncbi:MAG: lactonase family protein [Bryobacteraceae bacterium]